jgi:cobalt-zinc-cadmium efflux system outer membrane protein
MIRIVSSRSRNDASTPRARGARRALIVATATALPLLTIWPSAQAAPAAAPTVSASASGTARGPATATSAATAATAAPSTSVSAVPITNASTAGSGAKTDAPSTATKDASATSAANGDPAIPSVLTLDGAIKLFRERGFDLLIADASVLGAEGDEIAAGAVANPVIGVGVTKVFSYSPSGVDSCGGCSSVGFSLGVSDNGALMDVFVGKRPLRLKVARAALAVARTAKEDARRLLELQLKTSIAQLAAAQEAVELAKDIATAQTQTYEIGKLKYPKVINEGELARIQTAKLEADQQVDMAINNERVNRASIAFLLGVRGAVAPFKAEASTIKFAVPAKLASVTEDSLLRDAQTNRPDVRIAGLQLDRSEAAIDLARRYRYPDIALSLQYSQIGTGQNALAPPAVTFGVTIPFPLFYNQGGEIKRAQADYGVQSVVKKKVEAQVVSDVMQAYASFQASKATVERMENGGLLESAKKARDITQIQFNAGQTTLLDYLDATRTYIGVNVEYVNDRLAYWTAVFQLEAAVGVELRK